MRTASRVRLREQRPDIGLRRRSPRIRTRTAIRCGRRIRHHRAALDAHARRHSPTLKQRRVKVLFPRTFAFEFLHGRRVLWCVAGRAARAGPVKGFGKLRRRCRRGHVHCQIVFGGGRCAGLTHRWRWRAVPFVERAPEFGTRAGQRCGSCTSCLFGRRVIHRRLCPVRLCWTERPLVRRFLREAGFALSNLSNHLGLPLRFAMQWCRFLDECCSYPCKSLCFRLWQVSTYSIQPTVGNTYQ